MKKYSFLLFLVFHGFIYTQNQTNHWNFGNKAALNFNDGIVNVMTDSEMDTPAGSTSISDKLGNLLFYTNGQTVLSSSMTYGGELFSADTTVNTNLDLVSTDYIAYYELFDNDLVSFDLGINAKHLDGDIYLEAQNDATQSAARDFSGFVPMLYSRVEVGVPFTGFGAFVEGSFLAFDDNKITDYQAAITYGLLDNLAIDATLQLGYRSLEMELDDLDGIYTDFEFSGAFIGVEVHF